MSIHLVDTDLLQIDTSSAASLDVHAAFIDATLSTGVVINMGAQNTTIAAATTTTVCAAPVGATEIRNVTSLFVRNRHATLSCEVTVDVNAATDVELFKCTLLAGQTLQYSEQLGFYVVPIARLDRRMRLTADYTNATTGFTDITGLSCPVENGKTYNFEAWLFHRNDATTTGPRFGINGPTLSAILLAQLGPRVVTIGTVDATATLAYAAAAVTAVDTSIGGATLTGSVNIVAQGMGGVFTAGAAGIFILRGQSEIAVAAGLTVKAGSFLHVWEATG